VTKRVLDSRAFRQGRAFSYLEDQDRFLSAEDSPGVRLGVLGCGIMGLEHIRNAQLLGWAQVGGVFDPAPKSVRAALKLIAEQSPDGSPTIYTSLEEACADPETDVLLIATPNYTHLEVMRVATQYDKPIFLEKPIATTVADALEVCALAAAHSKIVRPGLQYRYKAIYSEAIKEVIHRRTVGQVHSVNLLEHRFPFLDKVGQWNKFNTYTGGTLIEKCCHYFDLLNLFAGARPTQVYAVGSQAVNFQNFSYNNKKADGLDQAQVTVQYDNGVIGSFSLCMFVPGAREELIVCGDTGRLQASEQAQLGEPHTNSIEIWAGENGASQQSRPSYPPYIARAGHHGATFFEHAAFAADLATGDYDGPSLAEGFWSVVVGAAAQESIQSGQVVPIESVLPDHFDAASV